MKPKAAHILKLAQEIADELGSAFFERLGPGKEKGNGATTAFMETLRSRVRAQVGERLDEKCICGNGTKLCVDYYLPDEATIIEVELGARNPHTNFERDIFKGLLAQEAGYRVDELVILGKPGSVKRLQMPDATAIRAWAKKHHKLDVVVRELSEGANEAK